MQKRGLFIISYIVLSIVISYSSLSFTLDGGAGSGKLSGDTLASMMNNFGFSGFKAGTLVGTIGEEGGLTFPTETTINGVKYPAGTTFTTKKAIIEDGATVEYKGKAYKGDGIEFDTDGVMKCPKSCADLEIKPQQGPPTKMDNAQGAEVKPDSYKLDHADSISDPQFDADDINNAYRTSVALATGRTAKLCTAVADTTMCLRNIENSVLHFTDSGVRFALTSGGPDGQLTLGQIEANFSGQLNVDVNGDRVNL